jgi:transcriptional regulator with XRE-family HTH domain
VETSPAGRALRAARERRGWNREALAYHAGVSGAAIAQIESGRRKDPRLSTLSALASALGIGVDALLGGGTGANGGKLAHRAFVYGSEDELLAEVVPWLEEGVTRSESALVVTTVENIESVRGALGRTAERVRFARSADWYTSPIAALNRYRDYLDAELGSGAARARIVGEPVWTGRTPREKRERMRYEAVLNLTFASVPATIVCPYDSRSLPADVLAGARRTHPELTRAGGPVPSQAYEQPESVLLGGRDS